jgi:YHS domain-containing protein
MNILILRLAIALAATLVPGVAMPQHEGHQSGAGQATPDMGQCARVQPVIDNIIATAMVRVESARLSNSPAEMRAAVDHVEAALRDIRAQLEPCSTAAGASDSRAGHTMPGVPQTPAAPAAGAPMDHSKMPMGGAPPAKPAAAGDTKPAARPAPMDHSKMPVGGEAQPGKVMDPVNGLIVDPATASKTTYQGQTYYFSSEQTRKEFLESPAKFARKPKG